MVTKAQLNTHRDFLKRIHDERTAPRVRALLQAATDRQLKCCLSLVTSVARGQIPLAEPRRDRNRLKKFKDQIRSTIQRSSELIRSNRHVVLGVLLNLATVLRIFVLPLFNFEDLSEPQVEEEEEDIVHEPQPRSTMEVEESGGNHQRTQQSPSCRS